MKLKLSILNVLLYFMAVAVLAVPTQVFKSFRELTQESPIIIIVHCVETPNMTAVENNGVLKEASYGSIKSDVDITSVLKGLARPEKSILISECALRQGEYYLVFGNPFNAYCQAVEQYRIIPLGLDFSTNMIAGKTLDEQIQVLLQRRLSNLNRQMKDEQEEKQRLQEGLNK